MAYRSAELGRIEEDAPLMQGGGPPNQYKARVENLKSALRKWVTVNEQRSMALQNSADESEKIKVKSAVQGKLMAEVTAGIKEIDAKAKEAEMLVQQQKEALDKVESIGGWGTWFGYMIFFGILAGGLVLAWQMGVFKSSDTKNDTQKMVISSPYYSTAHSSASTSTSTDRRRRSTFTSSSATSGTADSQRRRTTTVQKDESTDTRRRTQSTASTQQSTELTANTRRRHRRRSQRRRRSDSTLSQSSADTANADTGNSGSEDASDFAGFLPSNPGMGILVDTQHPVKLSDYKALMPDFGDDFMQEPSPAARKQARHPGYITYTDRPKYVGNKDYEVESFEYADDSVSNLIV